jgi:hypothetical protein
MMKADLAGPRARSPDRTPITSEEYCGYHKAKAISAKSADITAQVQAAIEKALAGK